MNNEQRNIQTRTLIDMSRRGQKQKKNIQASPQDTESPSHRRIGWLAPSYVGRWLVLLPPPCISRNSLSINFHSPFTCSSDANADIHKQIKVEVMNLKIRFLFSLLPNFIADSPLSVEVRKIKVCVYHANKTTPRECRLEVSLWISVLNVNCFVLSARFAYCTDSLFVIILSSLFLETSCSERVRFRFLFVCVNAGVKKDLKACAARTEESVGRAREEGNVLSFCSLSKDVNAQIFRSICMDWKGYRKW